MFNNKLHLSELGGSSTGDLSNAEGGELLLELLNLLDELVLRLVPELGSLDVLFEQFMIKKSAFPFFSK